MAITHFKFPLKKIGSKKGENEIHPTNEQIFFFFFSLVLTLDSSIVAKYQPPVLCYVGCKHLISI